MTNAEKLELLNSLAVDDFDCDGEVCNYVYVKVDELTRSVLNQLGCDDEYIDSNTEDDVIDISHIGWDLADWWDSELGFI